MEVKPQWNFFKIKYGVLFTNFIVILLITVVTSINIFRKAHYTSSMLCIIISVALYILLSINIFNSNNTIKNRVVQVSLIAMLCVINYLYLIKRVAFFTSTSFVLCITLYFITMNSVKQLIVTTQKSYLVLNIITLFVDYILFGSVIYILIPNELASYLVIIVLYTPFYFFFKYIRRDMVKDFRLHINITDFEYKNSDEIGNISILPYHSDTMDFYPIKINLDKNVVFETYSYTTNNKDEGVLCFSTPNDGKVIIADNYKVCSIVMKVCDKRHERKEKDGFYIVKLVFKNTENVPSVEIISMKRTTEYFAKFEYNKKNSLKFDEIIFDSAVFNQRFHSKEFEKIDLYNTEKIAIEIENEYGHGKTTISKYIEERNFTKNVYVSPINTKNTNINYEVFLQCHKQSKQFRNYLVFTKSFYLWSYYISFVLLLFTTFSLLEIKIETHFVLSALICTLVITYIVFPYLLGFKGHSGANQNRFYIDYISKFINRSKNRFTLIIIENFDRYSYSNFDDLFILLDGLSNSTAYYGPVRFIINSSSKYIDEINKKNYLYNIKKFSVRVKIDSKAIIREYFEFILKKEGFDDCEIQEYIKNDNFKEYFDFRNIGDIKDVIEDKYCLSEWRNKLQSLDKWKTIINNILCYVAFSAFIIFYGEALNNLITVIYDFLLEFIIEIFKLKGDVSYSINSYIVRFASLIFSILFVIYQDYKTRINESLYNNDITNDRCIKQEIVDLMNDFIMIDK